MNNPHQNQPSPHSQTQPANPLKEAQPRFLVILVNILRPLILITLSIAIPLTTSLALKSEPPEKNSTKSSPTPQQTPQKFTFFSLLTKPQTTPSKQEKPKKEELKIINKAATNLLPIQPKPNPISEQNNTLSTQINQPHKIFTKFNEIAKNNLISETNTIQTNIPNPTQQNPKKIQQNQPATPTQNTSISQIQLSLSDAIILAIQNNRDIKNAYLNRIAETQELATEEGKFRPTFTPEIAITLNRNTFGITNNNNNQLSIGADISVKMPAGGQFSFGWIGAARNNYTNNFPTDSELASAEQNLKLEFTQPLMRGFGVEINRASIEIARIREQINIITLKSTLTDTITSVIFAYRALQQAAERLKIETQFLELAKQRKTEFQILIDAGREAPVDILPLEKAIADREGTLLAAENNRQQAIANLLQILDIDREINIIPTNNPTPEINLPESQNIQQIALENNPNYLSSILNRDISKLNLLLAEDNQRWNLDFNASYGGTSNSTADTNQNLIVGITLSREFGNLSLKSALERSRVNLLKAENTLKDNRANLEIEIQNQLRDINLKIKQIEFAKNATQLAERQLDIEQQRLGLGKSSSREIVRFQNELIIARTQEIDAQIDYLNAITNLQQTLGITLNTWNITIETP